MVTTTFANLQDGFQFLSLFDQAFAQCMSGVQTRKTSASVVLPTDSGTIILGGNALYTLTVNTASTYGSTFAVIIYNEDTGRGKNIAINGLSSFILWPQQSVLIFNDNNNWKLSPESQPWLVPTNTTFNVDNVNGSDSATNDGLGAQGTSGAFLTVGHAQSVIFSQTLGLSRPINIQLPLVTSTPIVESPAFAGAMAPGVTDIVIVGNTTTPTNCQWQPATAIAVADYQSVTFIGVGWSVPGGNGILTSSSQFAIVDFSNCDFGTNSGGTNIAASANARVNLTAGCSISGSCSQFIQSSDSATVNAGTAITVNGTPNVGIFANCLFGGGVDVNGLSFIGGGTLSGQQFRTRWGGWINGDSGVSWPVGMSAGTATLGGLSDGATTTLNELTIPTIQAPASTNLTISGSSGDTILFGIGTTTYVAVGTNGNFRPVTDNTVTLGASSLRWSAIFGVNLTISGSHTSTAWTTSGIRYTNPAVAYTDTSSSGTVTVAYTDLFGAATINASTTTTYSSYYGSYFQAPVAGTNVTIAAGYALGADSIGATTASITSATITTITAGTFVGSTSVLISGQGGVGYEAGAGGTTTQTTNKVTAVTLNKISGEITMNNAALSAAAIVSFALTNTSIAASDIMALNHVSGGTPGAYTLNAQCAAGGATINVRNNTAGTLSEAIVLGYVVIKGAIT